MNYAQAIEQVKAGKKMLRPHWHWCWLELHGGKVRLVKDDDAPRRYTPSKNDQEANDWQEYEE